MREVIEVRFVGSGDLTIWLEDNSDGRGPTVIPVWPEDYPVHLAVYLTASGRIGIVHDRAAMLQTCRELLRIEPSLWFVVPAAELRAVTDTYTN